MPFVLIALGTLIGYLDYLGAENLQAAGSLIYTETFGANDPFWKWLGAMIIIGMIGYIPDMEPVATAFLVLVVIAIVLAQHSSATTLLKGL